MNKTLIWFVVVIVVLVAIVFFILKSSKPITENSIVDTTPDGSVAGETSGRCFIGGCSSQICSDQEGIVTTCEYKEEYACYKSASCERQTGGECGWTQTSELQLCLNLGVEGK
ncbi:MAG: hypothetical protein Q8O46_01600 [bacterium]|nr:hypothetical protein [bacterium]